MSVATPGVLALAAAAGGAVGALARHAANVRLAGRLVGGLPLSTWLVNVAGCLLAGLLLAWVESRGAAAPFWRALVVTGVLGGLTTFSAFGIELWQLLRDDRYLWLFAGAATQLCLGVAAVAVGFRLGRVLGID